MKKGYFTPKKNSVYEVYGQKNNAYEVYGVWSIWGLKG
jgi:hypothetical protein